MVPIRVLTMAMVLCAAMTAFGQDAEPETDPRTEAVKSMLQSYVKSFNEKDLDAVAGSWSKDCTFHDQSTGERVQGREAIRTDLKKLFGEDPELTLSATLDQVKFITGNVAQADGETLVTSPGVDPVAARFTAILVKANENWQISSLTETAIPKPANGREALRRLEWMIGRWVDEGETARIESTVRWSASNAFLLRSFAAVTEEGAEQLGTQIIGWDPRAEQIRSWAFNADGSFGEGFWSKNGEDWLIKSAQTLADGQAASGTYVLKRIDDETIRLQLIGHTIGGTPQPASDPVVMKRQANEAEGTTGEESTEPAATN